MPVSSGVNIDVYFEGKTQPGMSLSHVPSTAGLGGVLGAFWSLFFVFVLVFCSAAREFDRLWNASGRACVMVNTAVLAGQGATLVSAYSQEDLNKAKFTQGWCLKQMAIAPDIQWPWPISSISNNFSKS